MKRYLLLSLMIVRPVWGYQPYVSHTDTLRDDTYEIRFDTSYMKTATRVDYDGNLQDFQAGEDFQTLDVSLTGSYGFTSQFEGKLAVNFRQNQSTEVSGSELVTLRRSGPESVSVGFRYNWPREEGTQYAIFGNYGTRLFTNNNVNITDPRNDIVLGDDGPIAEVGLAMSYYSKSQNFLSGHFGYRNPGAALSSELFAEAEATLAWQKFAMFVGFETVSSMNQDAYGPDPVNKPLIANGSTYQYNSINRSWTAGYAGMSFAVGPYWRLGLKMLNRVAGISTDLGSNFLVTLARRSSGPDNFKKMNQAFKEYTIEATVSKVSKNRTGVVIDSGIADGIQKGMKIDFYHFDYLGGNELIASGFVIKASASKSMVKITRRFSKKRVEQGTVARGGLIRD
jgi:hypothetical protein